MTDRRQITGRYGEQIAARHLQQQGYTICAMNWRCPGGEIDIVAQRGPLLVFIEVKTRHGPLTERGFAGITRAKCAHLIASAHAYLDAHAPDPDAPWRIDAIAIALAPDGTAHIEHVEDALDW